MAKSKKMNLGPTKKVKPSGNVKFMKDYIFDPTNKADYVTYAVGGPVARVIGGIAKKGSKYVGKVYRNMGK
jgi:hypothetical protein